MRAIRPASPAHPVDRHVGHVLRLRRRALGLSQKAVAARLGVTFQQVQKYERGDNRISASTLHCLTLILDLPVTAFFDGLAAPSGETAGSRGASLVSEMIATPDGPALAEAFLKLPPGPVRFRLAALARAIGEAR
jgi:transcriptional regulator with XRE-family HTH domain